MKHRRLFTILLAATSFSTCVTAVFVWVTWSSSDDPETVHPTTSNTRNAQPIAPVIFPDRGEPRSVRADRLEAMVEQFRPSTEDDKGSLAEMWIELAAVRFEREQLVSAIEALDHVAELVPNADNWRRRDAALLRESVQAYEMSPAPQRELRKMAIASRLDALRLHTDGKFDLAIDAAKRLVSLRRQIGTQAACDLVELGRQLCLLGRLSLEHSDSYLQAAGFLEEAQAIVAQSLGRDHPQFADVQSLLGRLADDRGDFDAANDYYESALATHRATRGEVSLPYAAVLAQQGRMHLDWWEDYATGKGYRALQIHEQLLGQNHLECAESLEHLGMNAIWLFHFEKAERLLKRALAIRECEQGNDHPDTAEAKNWLSQAYVYQGDVAQASLVLGQAVELTRRSRGESHPRLIRYLANVARIGKYDWNPTRGEREGRRAIAIGEAMGMRCSPLTLDARIAVIELMLEEESPYGVAQLVRRNPQYIANFVKETLAAHGTNPRRFQLPTYPMSLVLLASIGYWDDYRSIGRDDADQCLVDALQIIQRFGADLHPSYSEYLLTRGRWHLWVCDYDAARRYLTESLEVIERLYGKIAAEVRAGAWRALSGVYMHSADQSPAANRCLQLTATLDEEIFRRNAAGQCDIDRFSMARARFFSLGACVFSPSSGLLPHEQYGKTLAAKGATSIFQRNERLVQHRPEFRQTIDEIRSTRKKQKEIAFAIPADPADYDKWREAMFQVADRKEAHERSLAIQLRGLVPRIDAVTPELIQARLPPKTALLDFISFTSLGPPEAGRGRLSRVRKVGVFIVTRDDSISYVTLGPVSEIELAITEWMHRLHDGDTTERTNESAQRVREAIWDPIADRLSGIEQVLIAPDGPICFVPFAALPGREPNSYLLEELQIGYVPSAQQWIDISDRDEAPLIDGLLLTGDVDYRTPSEKNVTQVALINPTSVRRGLIPDNGVWSNLPATKSEIESVVELFQEFHPDRRHKTLSGTEPTVETFQTALEQRWRYLHYAGHGLFADWQPPRPPDQQRREEVESFDSIDTAYTTNSESIVLGRAPLLLSGLVLSANGRTNAADAILTAEEVSGLDLRGAEMVVLSACETGLGKTAGGEGVLGLQRAFLNAGARSTVTSLWKVDDAATGVLMERFYHHLWVDRMSKWRALQQAQIDLLYQPDQILQRNDLLVSRGLKTGSTKRVANSTVQSGRKPSTSPSLWGAFVLYGDGR